MQDGRLLIDGNTLRLEDVGKVAEGEITVESSESAWGRIKRSRDLVEKVAVADAPVYGGNTGFGPLAEVGVNKEDVRDLQRNLLRSHSAGVGQPLAIPEARALLLLRINVLAKGFSGVRPKLLELAKEMLNRGVIPVVPE